MPSLGFQIEVLKQVVSERAAGGDPIATKLSQNGFDNPLMKFAVLGATGPDLLRYTPVSKNLASFLSGLVPSATSGKALTAAQISVAQQAAQTALQGLTANSATPAQQALGFELYFNPFAAAYSVLFSTLIVPVWPILNHTSDVFNRLEPIVASHNEFALLAMIGEILNLEGLQSKLAGLPATIAVLQAVIGGITVQGPWMEMGQTLLPPTDATLDRRYEFLRWHRSGAFAQNLLKQASSDNQKAFVFGWLCHIASSITGEPFVNNIVGGLYRTHWWRNRLVGNFIDSWTFGFFEQSPTPTMAGDNPSPPYFDVTTDTGWPSICTANLQEMFNVAGLAGPSSSDDVPDAVKAMASGDISGLLSSSPFPAEISKLLNDTIAATYTVPLGSTAFPSLKLPIVGVDASLSPQPAFTSDIFARAYIGAFAVYWFMTSGSGPNGFNLTGTPTGMPEPTWISSGGSPSPQQAGVNVGAAICAALLAILALLSILTGNLGAGLAAFGAAASLPIIDWPTLANDLFWLRKTFVDQKNLLRDALVYGGLAYPPPVMLGAIDPGGNTLPATDLTGGLKLPQNNVPATTGTPLCKTNAFGTGQVAAFALFPRQLDRTSTQAAFADLNFVQFPGSVQVEAPATDDLTPPGEYPNVLIQSGAAVTNGGIMSAGAFPTQGQPFGDAVANAVQLIQAQANGLLDYNLDADRGYGWQAWDPQPGSNPATGIVVAVQGP